MLKAPHSHASTAGTEALLQATGLAAGRGAHAAARPLFEGVDFALAAGEALHVAGPNGSGKTTLLRVLCGLHAPLAGEVRWRGVPLRRDRSAFHAEVLSIAHSEGLKAELSVLENLRAAQTLAGRPCTEAQALRALARVGLDVRRALLPSGALSQGQKRRAQLARLALPESVAQPQLLVLDEPFNALDQASTEVVCQLLAERLAQGAALVYTTHQGQRVAARATQHLNLGVPAWAEAA